MTSKTVGKHSYLPQLNILLINKRIKVAQHIPALSSKCSSKFNLSVVYLRVTHFTCIYIKHKPTSFSFCNSYLFRFHIFCFSSSPNPYLFSPPLFTHRPATSLSTSVCAKCNRLLEIIFHLIKKSCQQWWKLV